MSRFVLDTDIYSLIQEGVEPAAGRVLAAAPGTVFVTAITVEESLTGWYTLLRRVKTPDRLAAAYEQRVRSVLYFARLPILSYTQAAIARYEDLRKQKLNVAANDLRIAAIALENGATVVTRNLRDFQRVPHLVCEDWAAP